MIYITVLCQSATNGTALDLSTPHFGSYCVSQEENVKFRAALAGAAGGPGEQKARGRTQRL